MAHADISYEESAEAQDNGNPDPIKMFKNFFGGLVGNSGTGAAVGRVSASSSAARAKKLDTSSPDDLEHGTSGPKPASGSGGSVLESVGLKPNSSVRVMQQRYEDMTPEEKVKANAHAERMQEMVQAKLASLTPEQREAFEQKHEMLTKAVMAQMHEDSLIKAGKSSDPSSAAPADGDLVQQPRLYPVARDALKHLPRPPPGPPPESDEETRDRELLFAVRSGNPDELASLLKQHGLTPDACARAPADVEAHPLLHWAALNDQKEVLAFLVDAGADLNQRNPRQEVALHWAALNGNLRAVHLLVDAGCDRLASDARGYSAMHHAAQFGRVVILACLQRHGLAVDVRDANGRTPLHWAAYKGEERCALWLVDHGADPLAEDFEQCLPLHWAALQGFRSTCALLLANGPLLVALAKQDRTGGTAAQLAREKERKYDDKSREARTYRAVADYLEECAAKQREVSDFGKVSRHFTWFAWPLLAPVGMWQYYTVVMPETAYLYPWATIIFVVFYAAEWVAWTRLQTMDPGTYVLRDKRGSRHRQAGGRAVGDGGGGKDVRVAVSTVDDELCAHPVNPAQRNAAMYREMYLEALDRGLLVPVCTTCEVVKPVRSKHDRFTDVCVAKFDHYCPFMGVAIGQNNYTTFFFAMYNAFLSMWAWVYLLVMYTWNLHGPAGSFWTNFYETLAWQAFAWLYFPIALYATLMVGQHVMFIRRNLSTNEIINRYRLQYLRNKQNPFDRGLVGNLLEFLGAQAPLEMSFREYYAFEYEGRSHQVEENNARMRGTPLPEAPPSAEAKLGKRSCGHDHGGGSGGHGHSH